LTSITVLTGPSSPEEYNGKGRNLRVNDEKNFLKYYGDELRQIAITGHGKIYFSIPCTARGFFKIPP
jgi:hypothetical protein